MADIQFMNHPSPNKSALLIHASILIFMMLFSQLGVTQEKIPSASPRGIDSLSLRSGEIGFISLEPVFFDYAKTTLNEQAKRTLNAATRYILEKPEVSRILIEGHTDSEASSASNYKLSNIRANAVRDYLASQGIEDALFQVSALGENFPVDEYWTREGQHRNRRVEIYIIERSEEHTSELQSH